jgi:UDP-N-acetylmuramyl pentapeptide phosphotransferase/UDP-N-acetylglucosamine-1-phosphate transferase
MIPKIINVVNHKKLMDSPNQRSSHIHLTPTFGGVSFFMILIFTMLLIRDLDNDNLSLNIIAGLTVLLFTGLKDDLVVISPQSKLLGQLLAIAVFLFNTEMYEINLYGLFEIHKTGMYLGIIVTVFLMLFIINAFNLIDGIDGLAASIGITSLFIYAVIFYFLNDYFYCLICISLIGSLMAFLRFNLSSSKKIFMGDTGSLIIGFIVAGMTIKFLTLDSDSLNTLTFIPKNSIFVVGSILIFPIFDTIRVLIVRFVKKKNLLLSDKNHTHHALLNLGNSHIKSSFLISIVSLIFSVLFIYLATKINNSWIIAGVFIFIFIFFFGVFYKSTFKET